MTETLSFTATKFDSAEEKAKVLTALKKFIKAGTPEERFTKKLYHHLSLHFSHIAHTNEIGFFDTWFSTPYKRLAFLKKHRDSIIYGDPAYTWSDVQKALQEWLKENPGVVDDLQELINEAELQQELIKLEYLITRYPKEARKILEKAE
jgi:hypothetical protein